MVFGAQLLAYQAETFALFVFSMYLFFIGFNLQEAKLPALVSRVGPAGAKGTAMSIYSTFQFLGVFLGGVVGGTLVAVYGLTAVFLLNAVVASLWFLVSLAMKEPANVKSFAIRVANENNSIDQLRELKGVIDVIHIAEYREAFLRVNMDSFDRVAAEEILGHSL